MPATLDHPPTHPNASFSPNPQSPPVPTSDIPHPTFSPSLAQIPAILDTSIPPPPPSTKSPRPTTPPSTPSLPG